MTEKTPFISVAIASYNYGQYLPIALDALYHQTFKDFETIVIDDGSTDGTKEVVEAFLQSHSDFCIKYIFQENAGLAAARNRGLHASKGVYVLFHDADDWMQTNGLELLAQAAQDESPDRVYSELQLANKKGKVLEILHFPKYPSKWTISTSAASLYKRAVFVEHDLCWREGVYSEDSYINFYYNQYCSSCSFVRKPTYNWIQHASSMSAPTNPELCMIGNKMLREICDFTLPVYTSVENKEDCNLIEYELIKLYCVALFRSLRSVPLRYLLNESDQMKKTMWEYFPNYKENPYVFQWFKSPLRFPIRVAIAVTILCEKLHLTKLMLSVYWGVSRIYKFHF